MIIFWVGFFGGGLSEAGLQRFFVVGFCGGLLVANSRWAFGFVFVARIRQLVFGSGLRQQLFGGKISALGFMRRALNGGHLVVNFRLLPFVCGLLVTNFQRRF